MGSESSGSDKSDHSEVINRIFGKLQTFPYDITKFSPHDLPSAAETARQLMISSAASTSIRSSDGSNGISHVVNTTKLPQLTEFKSKVDFPKWDFDLSPWSTRAEQLFTQYLAALVVGVSVGAAVSAGLFGGLMASTSIIRWLQQKHLSFFPLSWFWDDNDHLPLDNAKTGNEHTNYSSKTDISYMNIESGATKIIVLRSTLQELRDRNSAQIRVKNSCREECRSCLINLQELMSSTNISWENVLKMTVYLLIDQCASEFYTALEELPNFAKERIVTSLIFVSRLENNALVQIEVLASIIR